MVDNHRRRKAFITRFKGNKIISRTVTTKVIYIAVLTTEKPLEIDPKKFREMLRSAFDKRLTKGELVVEASWLITVW